MAAPSPVLYALHHSIEPQGFENLCVDLLVREGHSRIIPGGKSRDHGRDAEVRYWTDSKRDVPQTAFQFSMEVKWEAKLRKDIAKITRHSASIERVVFVSSRPITIEKQDKLRDEFKASHQLTLQILDEAWFRIRLEEEHADLALKHLGITVPPTPGFNATQIKLQGLSDENQQEMLRHTSPEKLRATFTAQTQADPENSGAWKGLADVCYFLRDYDSALLATSKSLKLSQDEIEKLNLTALKANIIAEQGIASESRLLLNKAKELFLAIIARLGRSIDYYNLANVLGALGQQEASELHYRRSLEIDPSYAQSWKNLGSLLINMNRREEGMACIDRALELKPDLLEALCTKASVMVISSGNSTEAIQLMEQAFSLDPDLELRWPHAHYWHARALCVEGRFREALVIVEDRLERKLDCVYLGALAKGILAKLWRSDPAYIPKAEKFFTLRIDSKERDYPALIELLDLLIATEREDEAWLVLEDFLGLKELSIRLILERIPLSISDLTESFVSVEYYLRFRELAPLIYYAQILNDCELLPHDEVPEILFHLLLPAYFKLAAKFQEVDTNDGSSETLEVLLETYRLISQIFVAFGGSLLFPVRPETLEKQSHLITNAIFIGRDIPLIEVSRLLGFLIGSANKEIPALYIKSLPEQTAVIHEAWLTGILTNVGEDWDMKSWSK
ncbi:hypothetical protein [Luteolibacter sp.]|uniref:hypothetical protein n=1 Tax=Luteolibacter sp. TaxID=1962973 RepID=UPI0032648B41